MLSSLRRARADVALMGTVLPAAEHLAQADGIPEPGAEHLLLAALDLPDGYARRAFSAVGCDVTTLPRVLRQGHDEALRAIGLRADDEAIGAAMPPPGDASGPLRAQGSLQVAFARAVSLAKADGLPVSSGHLLLAVIEPDHGTVVRALTRLGIDRASLTRETRSLLGSS
ncbi:MAG TPA: Clp protease N-terminal domain-containing protein [Dermatophilaceae bacterium]|jgi:ATP-dependent Clp protease ATP-binding subunit ClpA|nr:Clp protease N-terminal domain-containing protein [Dermatophilaceae bacterium]